MHREQALYDRQTEAGSLFGRLDGDRPLTEGRKDDGDFVRRNARAIVAHRNVLTAACGPPDPNGDLANRPIHKRASVLSDTAINVEPKDGWDNYNTYMANNLDITDEMIKTELHGEVELTFDVKPNGTISNVRVNKSLDPAYDEAAKRLIMQGPQWKVKKGKKTSASVKVKF